MTANISSSALPCLLPVCWPRPSYIPTCPAEFPPTGMFTVKWMVMAPSGRSSLIFPGIMLRLLGLFAILPWLSPRRFEVETFRSTYLYIMLVFVAFFAFIHALMLWAAVSGQMDIDKAIMGGVCLLVVLLGNVMGKVRRNFYIGIRTPWTIADERVWNCHASPGSENLVLGGLTGLILALAGGGPGFALFRCWLAPLCRPSIH